ncbi:DNA polymerase epsilon catalytic subunit, partial [Coemansia sp. RSA 2611]
MVDEAACAACDFNEPGKTCDRRMAWLWRGEYFPPKRSEVAMLRRRLQGEVFAGAGGAVRTYDQLGAEAQAGELRARVVDYSKKVYHRQRETRVEERQAVVCQRENPFYVDTVRSFRDRRYVYKGLLKASKQQQDAAAAAGDAAAVAAAKKLVVVYDSLQLAHKCILNSFYGYVMRKGARWHSLEMAGVVCLTGSRIIQMARQRVEQVGRPLELDTDGIWCALPRTFPENYAFALRGGGTFAISYPCTMLNHLVFDAFTNHQYQTRDGATGAYSVRAENSIFFEVDGPYRAMILPASKEADKLLKKRYAVFEHDGSLAELKGFEVKRRGELKLIKIFQSQIFGVFLQGDSLAACYAAVARVADQWLDILFSRARGLPDAELFDLITENRSMSKALDAYGGMKSTSICTARRLAEFLGDQMVKDKGLACKFVISRMPADQPVSERAVPVAIFAADAATRRLFLRRWLRSPQLGDADIRDILDWDYYLERFGSVIQKLITIPAAMQGVANPVPRIRHPDWLAKRVGAAASGHKQRQITDMFKKSAKSVKTDGEEDAGLDAAPDIEGLKAAEPDIEDLGRSAAPRPKTAVCRRPVRAEPAPDPARGYAAWLAHAKPAWRAWRRARALRGDGAEPEPDEGAFFSRTHVTLARSAWHVVQWAETDTPGELRAWAWVGGQLHGVRVAVPRTLYVASAVRSAQLGGSGYFAEARGMVLPRAAPGAPHLYRCKMPEAEFRARRASWSSFFAHPRIAGVYETELTALDRALIGLGAGARLTAQARRRGAGRSLGAAVALGDLAGVDAPGDTAGLAYALLYHAAAGDARQYFALVEPQAARARVWVVGAGAAQLPDVARLYRDARAAASVDGGAFAYPDALAVGVHAHATAAAAYRAVGQALAAARAERPATVLVCHAALAPRQLQARVRAIADFPTVAAAAAGDALPALDWARHASRRMVAALLGCAQWLGERIALARYADVPLGNLPADAPLFLADVFFARKLALARHVLWWSPSSVPDLGGRQHDEPAAALDADDALEFNAPGSYAAACAELEVRGLAVATVLKAPLVNEIEGAFGVFGFDAADPAPDGASDGPGPRDRAPDEPSPHMPAAASADNNVPAATFQLLRALLRDWCHAAEHSPFAAMMADHFYRWLTRPSALLHDPALARLVRSLMRKVFLQLKA